MKTVKLQVIAEVLRIERNPGIRWPRFSYSARLTNGGAIREPAAPRIFAPAPAEGDEEEESEEDDEITN